MDSIIRSAIRGKILLSFDYQGLPRVAEPHVYGRKDGKVQLLTYQVRGESRSGKLPNWRRVEVPEVENLQALGETFPGPRPFPSGQHSAFDDVWEVVK